MALQINRYVEWKAGEGTPVKYSFAINATLAVEDIIDDTTAVISLIGNITVTNHPMNSRNSWAASDFAVLTPGDVDVSTHPFIQGTSYYQQTIPFLPAPQNSDQSRMLVEFRGDTWASDPINSSNRVSLWTYYGGLEADQLSAENSWQYPINISFEIPVPGTGDAPVLSWITSGADNSTSYGWMDKQVWASWFDLDYRPGAILDNAAWKSHNRSGGTCHILSNTTGPIFTEMRTSGGPTAMGNPPSSYHDGKWYNSIKIGV